MREVIDMDDDRLLRNSDCGDAEYGGAGCGGVEAPDLRYPPDIMARWRNRRNGASVIIVSRVNWVDLGNSSTLNLGCSVGSRGAALEDEAKERKKHTSRRTKERGWQYSQPDRWLAALYYQIAH